jgi:hypothetical protein
MKGMQILNFMGRSNRRLLVHKHMAEIKINETVDIILTPHFYTFIREELAIKFTYQAKNIAPALFDDYLESNKSYQYHVYKCGEGWCFFAYAINEIISFLQQKGIEPYRIGKIYFAQELASQLNKPLSLSNHDALYTIDQTVTILPKRLFPSETTYGEIDLEKVVLRNGISISSSLDSVIPMKQTVIISSLLLILAGEFMIEGHRIKASIADQYKLQEDLLADNPKLASSLIRNSQLERYQPINDQERKKRDNIMLISKILSNRNSLKKLTVDEKKISFMIKTKDSMEDKQVIKKAKKDNFKILSQENHQIVLEKSL